MLLIGTLLFSILGAVQVRETTHSVLSQGGFLILFVVLVLDVKDHSNQTTHYLDQVYKEENLNIMWTVFDVKKKKHVLHVLKDL